MDVEAFVCEVAALVKYISSVIPVDTLEESPDFRSVMDRLHSHEPSMYEDLKACMYSHD